MDEWSGNPVLACATCGTELPSDAKFCWHCGTPLARQTRSASSSRAPTDGSSLSPADQKLFHDLQAMVSEACKDVDQTHAYGLWFLLLENPHLANIPHGEYQRTALHRLVYGNPKLELSKNDEGLLYVNQVGGNRKRAFDDLMKTKNLDLNVQDSNGSTPLHLAISCTLQLPIGNEDNFADFADPFMCFHQRDIIDALLKAGADPNIPNLSGDTPAHAAAYRGRDLILQMLFNRGADPDAIDKRGWTPLHYATRYNYMFAIQVIQERSDARAGIPAPLPEPWRPGEE